MTKFNTIKELKALDSNAYNISGFVTNEWEIHTVEDFLKYETITEDENWYYGINWENDSLYSENGTKIEPAY
jgi:hypothetical protein